VSASTYKIQYNQDADVLTLTIKDKGKLSHAKELEDILVHFDQSGKPLFLEILKASKIVPRLVEGLAKKEGPIA
jgi:uncharacterized protein YuzE